MPGSNNRIQFGNGYRLEPSAAEEWQLMQLTANDVSCVNNAGSPEGVVPANVGSVCYDRTNGDLYVKKTGTGNTGWLKTTTSSTDLHDSRFIVSAGGSADGANYTTIASAITAATSAGGVQTIMIQPGTYTENLTWPANINLVAHVGDSDTPTVTIIGKLTCTDAGTRTASGIRFQTNSDNILSITGTEATIVEFNKCFINATNATAFNSTTTSTSTRIRCFNCRGELGTTGIAYFSILNGAFSARWSQFLNTGFSVTQCTAANNSFIDIQYCDWNSPILYSGSNTCSLYYSFMRLGGYSVVPLTTSGTGTFVCKYSRFESQSQFAISVGAGTTVSLDQCSIDSTSVPAISGTGTLILGDVNFTSTSQSTSSLLTRSSMYNSSNKLVFLSTQTASASSSISFTSLIDSRYSSYLLIITNLVPTTNATNVELVYSNDNGATYLATNYVAGTRYTAVTGTTFSNANSTSHIRLSGPVSNAGFFSGNYIITGLVTAAFGMVTGNSSWNDTTLGAYSNGTTAGLNNGTTAINAIRVRMSSGNITSGKFTLYGIRENIS